MTIEAITKYKHLFSLTAWLAGDFNPTGPKALPFVRFTYGTETSNVNITVTDLLTELLFCVLNKCLKYHISWSRLIVDKPLLWVTSWMPDFTKGLSSNVKRTTVW